MINLTYDDLIELEKISKIACKYFYLSLFLFLVSIPCAYP